MIKRPKILIIYGYHPKETFASKIGEDLFRSFPGSPIQVVKYTGKQDNCHSTRNLRRFVGKFGPSVLPVVLHNDRKTNTEAIIIYCAKSRQEKRKMLKSLFGFVSRYNKKSISVIFDTILIPNAKHSLVEVEFNPKTDIKKAKNLVRETSKYLLNI